MAYYGTQGQTGYIPAHVEPLHQYERDALVKMANPGALGGGGMVDAQAMLRELMKNPSASAQNFTSPQAAQYMTDAGQYATQAAGAASAAMSPITQQEAMAVSNPFVQAQRNRLSEQVARMKAQNLSNQGLRGARSFGDTATGIAQGMIDQEEISKGADIEYQGFQDAMGILERLRARQLGSGQLFGDLSSRSASNASTAQQMLESALGMSGNNIKTLFGMGQEQTAQGERNIDRALGAGQYIRDYNQSINDLIVSELAANEADAANRIGTTQDFLSYYQSGQQPVQRGANSLETLGGAAGILSSVLGGSGGGVGGLGGVAGKLGRR